jgi:hypothetical protein
MHRGYFLALLIGLLSCQFAQAASLIPDKSEIAIGETVNIKLDADFILSIDWSASPGISILDSGRSGATIKGVAAGPASVTAKINGKKKSVSLSVRAASTSSNAVAPQSLPMPLPDVVYQSSATPQISMGTPGLQPPPSAPPGKFLSTQTRFTNLVFELISFYEKSGNKALADQVRTYLINGKILLADQSWLNPIMDMNDGDPYYWAPTGSIYIPSSRIEGAVKANGEIDWAAFSQIAGSIRHEFVHINEHGWLTVAQSPFQQGSTSRELEAYTKTIQSFYDWARQAAKEVDAAPSTTSCERAQGADKAAKFAGEMNRHYAGDLMPKDTSHEAPLKAALEKATQTARQTDLALAEALRNNREYQNYAQAKRDLEHDLYTGANPVQHPRYQQQVKEYESIMNRVVDNTPALARAHRLALENKAALTNAQKSYNEYLNYDVRPDIKGIKIQDASGKPLGMDQAMQEMTQLAGRMNAIVEQCKKEQAALKGPMTAKMEDDLLNCLCRFCGGASGGYFTRDAKSECNGGCTCWGPLSGWCTAVPTPDAAGKSCAASAFGVDSPSPELIQKGLDHARGANRQKMEADLSKQLTANNLDAAISIAENALKADPNLTSPMFREVARRAKNAGWEAFNKADPKTAIKRLEQAYSLDPNDADTQSKLQQVRNHAAQPPGEANWAVAETSPGMYRVERTAGQVRIARQGNNPGGLQYAGLRIDHQQPVEGNFDAQVSFADARIEGGLNQIELHATFADGSIFYVVRDREGSGSHIWAPGLQGNQPCGRAGTLRMERRGDIVTGYCDGRAIWSSPRKAALTKVQFVLQNNGTNDPISVTFRDYQFKAGATASGGEIVGNATGLAGTWSINANNYTGKLEFTQPGGKLAGRVWFDVYQAWEELRDIRFDGRTLRFLRPGPNQRYTGTLSGNEVRGTFDGGGSWDWVITRVSGNSPAQMPPVENINRPATSKRVLEDDKGPYTWIEGTEEQTKQIQAGRAAFRSTGNNHFTHRLGIAGNYADQYRYLDFWIYLMNPSADIQLQVQVDGAWGKRWGFDGDAAYNGYGLAMEGTTAGLASGRWLHQRVDLLQQLHLDAGQAITGLAFSSDGGDVYYDSVYLLPNENPIPPPRGVLNGKLVLEDDVGPYSWVEATAVQKEVIAHGKAAFKSTGNNHFTKELGVVGDYPEQFRSLSFWLFPIGAEADIQLQVQVDGVWGKRWGFDAGPKYNGYGWAMEGATTGLKPGQWQEVSIDLLNQLHINPGQKITGMAFSSDNGDVYYDSVYLHPNANPARKPAFQPAGKLVLEDRADGYNWVEGTEVQNYLVFNGAKAFRSTGNNHFLADLGVAGSGRGQFRHLNFWAFFMGSEADVQVQVQVNGAWGKRWGYDAGPVYNGFGWAMEGTSTRLPNGRWVQIQLDLLGQLHLQPGDKITGLAFSSDNADVIYDSVYLLPDGVTPGVSGGFQGDEMVPVIPEGGRDYTYTSPGGRDYTYTPTPTPQTSYPPVSGGGTLNLDKTRFVPGESIVVRFTASSNWPSDAWVGIIPASIPHGNEAVNDQHDITYQYLGKRTAGSLTFTAPGLGNWDFRLHDTDGGGKEFASVTFVVGAPQTVAGGGDGSCVNLARGKHANQSSTSPWSHANDAEGAVDGIINGGYGFHTENERNPWWQVDLGNRASLTEIRIFNRLDCCAERAQTLQVLLSDDARSWRTVYRHNGTVFGGKDGKPLVVRLGGESARYLRLQLNEANWFHLDEVEVCGEAGASPGGRDYTGQVPTSVPSATKSGVLFDNGNIAGVDNGPSQPTTFTLNTKHVITLIQDYHWNSARGATPGTIGLRDASGRIYGPWQSVGTPGQGGVPNAYWTVRPDITLPAGTYSVVDSHPASWSRNGGSQQRGFTRVEGYPTNDGQVPASGRDYSYSAPPISTSSPSDGAAVSIYEQTERALEALEKMLIK